MLTHIWSFVLKTKMAKPLNCKKSPAKRGFFFGVFLESRLDNRGLSQMHICKIQIGIIGIVDVVLNKVTHF